MDNSKYNGWANYMTWRVRTEYFEDYVLDEELRDTDALELSDEMHREYMEHIEFLMRNVSESCKLVLLDHIEIALEDVDWHEIAIFVHNRFKRE
jgi:hypothetical protein